MGNLLGHEGHDGSRSNVDVLLTENTVRRSFMSQIMSLLHDPTGLIVFLLYIQFLPSEYDVDEAAHDGSVETILRRQPSYVCIGNTLKSEIG